jgi:hypothetical protein|tara:strand:+ start:261 stop:1154 length:894 start_codon:yes stop_codon:yes gene_type:complete
MPEAAEKEELEIIETEDEAQEVETQEAGTEVEAEAEEPEQNADNEDELASYSESVQRRIRTLTGKYREEERQRQAAVEYAEAVQKQNEDLKSRLDKLDQSYVGEFGNRIESQVVAAKEAYKKAYDEGDADAMFEAQQTISRLAMEQSRYEQVKRQNEERAQTAQQPQEQPVQQAAPQQPAKPDPKAEAWASKNDWFGSDQTMTYAAFGIHRQLIEDEGFDPTSDEYYTELDRRVRTEFPHKFKEQVRDAGPRVASAESTASKSSKKGRRTVKLTPSQIAIAKRLNVPLEEYAKYVKE